MAKIVVLEDDDVFAALLAQDLAESGHSVDVFGSSDAVMTHLATAETDVVLADIYIKDQTGPIPDGGITLAGRMKRELSEERRAQMVLIMISGEFTDQDQENLSVVANSFEADAVLAKPFSPDDAKDLIASLLAARTPVE
ncbi:MAG: response regulator [Mangrovicoccus sp.]